MGRQLTLELPDEVLHRAERLAAATRRDLSEVLQEALVLAFPPLDVAEAEQVAMERLPDAQVLALCDARLPAAADARLSELLERQQAGSGDEAERAELAALMQRYQSLWLRQSEALAEAVRRGLRPPLAP